MNIVICGSMKFAKQMYDISQKLINKWHSVVLPRNTENYAKWILSFDRTKSI